jgi:hypothetical protein
MIGTTCDIPPIIVVTSTILIRLFYDHDRAARIGHNS